MPAAGSAIRVGCRRARNHGRRDPPRRLGASAARTRAASSSVGAPRSRAAWRPRATRVAAGDAAARAAAQAARAGPNARQPSALLSRAAAGLRQTRRARGGVGRCGGGTAIPGACAGVVGSPASRPTGVGALRARFRFAALARALGRSSPRRARRPRTGPCWRLLRPARINHPCSRAAMAARSAARQTTRRRQLEPRAPPATSSAAAFSVAGSGANSISGSGSAMGDGSRSTAAGVCLDHARGRVGDSSARRTRRRPAQPRPWRRGACAQVRHPRRRRASRARASRARSRSRARGHRAPLGLAGTARPRRSRRLEVRSSAPPPSSPPRSRISVAASSSSAAAASSGPSSSSGSSLTGDGAQRRRRPRLPLGRHRRERRQRRQSDRPGQRPATREVQVVQSAVSLEPGKSSSPSDLRLLCLAADDDGAGAVTLDGGLNTGDDAATGEGGRCPATAGAATLDGGLNAGDGAAATRDDARRRTMSSSSSRAA